MSPASPLPIPPSSAHCRGSEAGEVRDVEAAVAVPRAVDKRQRGFEALPPQLRPRVRLPFPDQVLPNAYGAATGAGRRDDLARRQGYRPPAISSEENRFDACGGRTSGVDDNITTSSEANPFRRFAMDSISKTKDSYLPENQAMERRKRVESALEPLCDMAPFVLVCTGDPGRAVVVPVAVGENADAVDQWTAIRRTLRNYLSRWRSWLGPARLELVNIRIVGPQKSQSKVFQGVFEPVDVVARLSLLRREASNSKFYLTEPVDNGFFEDWCYHDTSSDRVVHRGYCCDPDFFGEGTELSCHVEKQQKRLERISKLELIPTWPMFLADPSLAWGNDPLLEEWIYRSTTILPSPHSKVIHSVAQIEFTGFRLLEWPYEKRNAVPGPFVVGSMVTFCGIIFVIRVIHGDWGIAYTAGAFFVALAGVLSTWVVGQSSNHTY